MMSSRTLAGRFEEQMTFFEKRKKDGELLMKQAGKKRKVAEKMYAAAESETDPYKKGEMLADARESKLLADEMEEKGKHRKGDDELISYLLDVAPVLQMASDTKATGKLNDAVEKSEKMSTMVNTNIRGKKSMNETMVRYMYPAKKPMDQPITALRSNPSQQHDNERDSRVSDDAGGGSNDAEAPELTKGEIFETFVRASSWHENSKRELDKKDRKENMMDQSLGLQRSLMCEACNERKVLVHEEATCVCPNCGISTPYQIFDTNSVPHDDTPFVCDFTYKRENHLSELLNQFTGKSQRLPDEVLDKMRAELKKHKIDPKNLNAKVVREHLKRLKLSKHYDQAHNISEILGGQPAPKLSPALLEKVRVMFKQIQEPFERAKERVAGAKGRKNMLSYKFCIGKILQLLGQDELSEMVPTLKSRDKLMLAESVWFHICEILQWEYIAPK